MLRGFGKTAQDEVARLGNGGLAIGLAECVVEEAVEQVFFLDWRSQALEKLVLRAMMYNPVGARDEQLCRDGDRLCVADHAIGRFVECEQDVDRNGAGNQRVGIKGLLPFGIVRQEL